MWAEYLNRFKVPPGPATLCELQRQQGTPSVTASSDDSSDESCETFLSAFDKVYIKLPSPVKSPPFKPPTYFATPPRPPRTMISPTRMNPSWNSGVSTSASLQEGSKMNPSVINIDVKHPERNREFDINFVEQMKHGDYIRKGYHIRVNAGVMDMDLWEARMYQGEGYNNPVILVKGPSCTL
jgi:hypothetical protein